MCQRAASAQGRDLKTGRVWEQQVGAKQTVCGTVCACLWSPDRAGGRGGTWGREDGQERGQCLQRGDKEKERRAEGNGEELLGPVGGCRVLQCVRRAVIVSELLV